MRALTRAGTLDQHRNGEILGALTQRAYIIPPRRSIKVNRDQPARLVRQERVDPDRLPSFQVAADLGRRERDEPAIRAVSALDLWFEAHSRPPLIPAAWRPPGPSGRLRALPAGGEHVPAPPEQRVEQRHTTLGGPDVRAAVRSLERRKLPREQSPLAVKLRQADLGLPQIEDLHGRRMVPVRPDEPPSAAGVGLGHATAQREPRSASQTLG